MAVIMTGKPVYFSVEFLLGSVEDAVAIGYKDEQGRPFFRVSLSNRTELDIYWWTPDKFGPTYWYDRSTHTQTYFSNLVGDALASELYSRR